jgi:formylglycine-generating enzyme required for sulfatase activity
MINVNSTPVSHTVKSIDMDMTFCYSGTFTIGSPNTEEGRGADEVEHQVILSNGFYLGSYEVTQAQYQVIMAENLNDLSEDPSHFKGSNRPVEGVSWNDVQVFLSRLNQVEQTAGHLPTGWKYMLPTEAQWEYACRAGANTTYNWGDDKNSTRANFNWNDGPNTGNDFKQTREVGQYAANQWGFFDMHGNVSEWVQDWKSNFTGSIQVDPKGPESGSIRVCRGGSWYNDEFGVRSAKRGGNPLTSSYYVLGFRVSLQAE